MATHGGDEEVTPPGRVFALNSLVVQPEHQISLAAGHGEAAAAAGAEDDGAEDIDLILVDNSGPATPLAEQLARAFKDACLDRLEGQHDDILGTEPGLDDDVDDQLELAVVVDAPVVGHAVDEELAIFVAEHAPGKLLPDEVTRQGVDEKRVPLGVVAAAVGVEIEHQLGLVAVDDAVLENALAEDHDVTGGNGAAGKNLMGQFVESMNQNGTAHNQCSQAI